MEREILFRGQRTDNGGWVYGYLERRPSAIQMPDYAGPWYIWTPPVDPDDFGAYYNVDPATIGQYTGMPDKIGKKIFEGDLLRYTGDQDDNTPYRVHWRGMGWYTQHENCMPDRLDTSRPKDWEVVGNIWDNPELLEVTK